MNIGILGVTGAVGREMIQLLEERKIPVDSLRLFASGKSAGTALSFRGKNILVEEVKEDSFADLDVVLGAVNAKLSRCYAPWILKSQALYIDNSSAFRMEKDVPLIVAEINPDDILNHHGIISNPNCVTMIGLMACFPIHQISPVRKMIVSTYQAVSGAGSKGIAELMNQMHDLVYDHKLNAEVFDFPVACNVIPCIGQMNEEKMTSEELKFQHEARKILHHEKLSVCCTCARVPVVRSHCLSMMIECEDEVNLAELKEAYQKFPGVEVCDDIVTPLDSAGQDDVFVCRLRHDPSDKRNVLLWCTSDQIRKGAALNAIQILEIWMKRKQLMCYS